MKIISIIGARPQFIKAAMVSKALSKCNRIKEIILHTGQHFDANMSDIFFRQMKIPKPDYNLGINSMTHGAMTGEMLQSIEQVLLDEKPDWVIVYGDTNSTIAGALAARKMHIKVAHVEAGLRSGNMNMPEEINRILTDRISNALFCPTDKAMSNLKKEGYNNIDCDVLKSGDVMQDAAEHFVKFAEKPKEDMPEGFILVTVHRQENTDDEKRLSNIIDAFNEINKKIDIIFPMHPRTRSYIKSYKLKPEFEIIEPVGYLQMLWLLQHCSLVITDSGGLQKEAFFMSKPCVTVREETEWVELVENGFNFIAGAEKSNIIQAYKKMISVEPDSNIDLYGSGKAAQKIANYFL